MDCSKQRVFIKTYGCQMNEYDSEKMFRLLSDRYTAVDSPEDAELVLINTCSVREKGEHKLFSLLGSLRELKDAKRDLIVGVAGCVAQQEGSQILKRSSAVDFVVGTHNLSLVPSLVDQAKQGVSGQVAIDYREDWEDLPLDFAPMERDPGAAGAFPVRALVAIQRGCNKRCAFCVVPNTRGNEVSRSPQEILREVKLKVRMGAKEVLLLGQTVNSYGRDLTPRFPFDRLVREIAEIDGLERIRFTSPHPAEVRPEFIALYGEVPQLCDHIHLPLQSGSDRILKLMNRNYRMHRYLEIVDAVRERRPDIAITTDIIVGFPTESVEDFEMSLEAISRVRYNSSYSFMYSRRPHTVALTQFREDEEIPLVESHRRLLELQAHQDRISAELNSARIGSEVEVLLEGYSDRVPTGSLEGSTIMRGRIPQNTPVEVIVPAELHGGGPNHSQYKPGVNCRVLIESAGPYGIRGAVTGTA